MRGMSDILSASLLAEHVFGFTAACTCDPVSVCMCVRAASTVSSLRSDGSDDSVVVELELSHVLGRRNRPFNTHQPIRRGMLGAGRPWERPCRGADGWRG